ncbi:MAG TPA: helix-turn-helix domain-containing protein [Vicinamibacterales bacterium]|nr:helix-turn-helix domain-containing protein [Vicinamibacterales bacterium]
MVQVIQRAWAILEFLSTCGPDGRPLAEIAEHVQLNKATCSHIVKTLVELNAAEQVAPRKGYRLGPAVYTLARGQGGFSGQLIQASEWVIERLAAEIRETVMVAVLRNDRRFTLCQVDGTQEIQIRHDPSVATNIYELATGRLLLAYAGAACMERVVALQGYPGRRWNGIENLDQLHDALSAIREAGREIMVTPGHVVGLAYPIRRGEGVVAALGVYLPEFRFHGEHREAILRGMERAAAVISSQLGGEESQGA